MAVTNSYKQLHTSDRSSRSPPDDLGNPDLYGLAHVAGRWPYRLVCTL